MAEKWGQSALHLGDLLPSFPLLQTASAILTNTEPFTGRPVYNDVLDGAGRITGKYFDLLWKEAMPSLAPGGYGFNKLKVGLQNTFFGKNFKDWADRPIEFTTAVLSSLAGIKLSPANQQKLKQYEVYTRKKIASEVEKKIGKLKGQNKHNEISREELEQRSNEFIGLKKRLIEERPKL